MIDIRNFLLGAIVSFGSIALAAWLGGEGIIYDTVLIIIMLIGVPLGMIMACWSKRDAKCVEGEK